MCTLIGLQGNHKIGLPQKGFSLIEVMVVVSIIGILASIALPSYVQYVKRGKATEATSNLAQMKNRIEQYFQDNRTYVGGPCTATDAKYFSYSCATTASTFIITASPVASDMTNFSFTIDQNGNKTSVFDGTSGACWLTSKGGTC